MGIMGAVSIPNVIVGYDITALPSLEVNYNLIRILSQNLFYVAPEDIHWSIIRVENMFGVLDGDPDVRLVEEPNGTKLIVKGRVRDNVSIQKALRIDLNLTSSNYEDMHVTIYIATKFKEK